MPENVSRRSIVATWDAKFFFTTGTYYIALLVSTSLRFIHIRVRPSIITRYCHSDGGKPVWDLVTGASDGICYALAIELAH